MTNVKIGHDVRMLVFLYRKPIPFFRQRPALFLEDLLPIEVLRELTLGVDHDFFLLLQYDDKTNGADQFTKGER